MDVILRSADREGGHLVFPGDSAHEGPKALLQSRCDQFLTFLGREDAMNVSGYVRHDPTQPSLRDFCKIDSEHGVKTPCYCRSSLRDNENRIN